MGEDEIYMLSEVFSDLGQQSFASDPNKKPAIRNRCQMASRHPNNLENRFLRDLMTSLSEPTDPNRSRLLDDFMRVFA